MPSLDPVTEEAPRLRWNGQSTSDVPADSQSVLQQLERILASRFFISTKRYSGLLRYLVEQGLGGQTDFLKERTIGVDVFGRSPEYDCNSDHVVRTAIGEIRKRLAQYYLEPDHETELRIDVPPGTYVPRFRVPPAGPVTALPSLQAPAPAEEPASLSGPRRSSRMVLVGAIVLAVIAVVAGALVLHSRHSVDSVDRFWSPLTASDRPILLCVGDLSRSSRPSAPAVSTGSTQVTSESEGATSPDSWSLREFSRLHAPRVFAGDAIALARLMGAIQPRHGNVRILSQSETTLEDLRGVPAVLIGLGTNEWTSRLTGRERFSVVHSSPGTVVTIRDKEHPERNDWSVDYAAPYLQINRDYAVVSRIRNPTTEQMVVVVGGIYTYGNIGAAEFLSNPDYLKSLEASAPPDWDRRNLEFVLSVDVIRGKSGVPRLLAAHFW